MSVISGNPRHLRTSSQVASTGGFGRRATTGVLLVVALLCVSAIIIAGSLLAYGLRHDDAVFSGASSAGVDLGGSSVNEATEQLNERFVGYIDEPIAFQADNQTIYATPRDLGVTFDARQTAERAYEFGRDGNLWNESRNWLDALAGGYEVTPVMRVDAATFAAYMEHAVRDVAVAPQDAAFIQAVDGSISIQPAMNGVAVDVEATFERFLQQARVMSSEPITIATVATSPSTTDPVLQGAMGRVETLAGAPLELRLDGVAWNIPASDLYAMLYINRSGDGISVTLDESELRSYIRSLESEVFAPGSDASVRAENDTFVVVASTEGRKLDIESSMTAALSSLESGSNSVELVTTPVLPNITDDEAQAAVAEASRLTANPVTVSWDGGSIVIEPSLIASAVSFDTHVERNPHFIVNLDQNAFSAVLAPIADDVLVEPSDADLRWIDGQVTVRTPEQLGRELDTTATTDAILRAITEGSGMAAVATKDLKPLVTAESAGSVVIRDRLSGAGNEYGTSSPARLHNVELASSRLNGALVPPGGTFSFNRAVGPVTYENGYQTGYGIYITNGTISTIPSVGGGICQVATTVFQTAFWAGMPIEERSWHLYWIPRYGAGEGGLKGLDATVDDAYGLDFLFKNTSNDWIAVKTGFNGSNLSFELWGTNTGWDVQVDPPVITNVVRANQEMVYEESSEIERGTSVFVEHAEDGFDAAIHRVVRRDGQVIDEMTFHSSYVPARNTTLVGTG